MSLATVEALPTVDDTRKLSITVGSLMHSKYRNSTIDLWIAFFMSFGTLYVVYGSADVGVAAVLSLVFLLMFFVQGAFTGVGWAIGAIVGPIDAGLLLGTGVSIGWTFTVFALPMLIAAVLVTRIDVQARAAGR